MCAPMAARLSIRTCQQMTWIFGGGDSGEKTQEPGYIYLDRDVHSLSQYIVLITNEEDFKHELKCLNIEADFPFVIPGAHATVHHFTRKPGDSDIAMVCMPPNPKNSIAQIAGLLAHEAVHIWKEHVRLIGEKNPSEEFEAYGIQNITQTLLSAYLRQTGRRHIMARK